MSEYLQGNISERIRDLRRKNNLTQEQLADMLDIHKATISRIENGDSVTDEIALSIAKHFGVSLDFLFGVTDDPEPVNFVRLLILRQFYVRHLIASLKICFILKTNKETEN